MGISAFQMRLALDVDVVAIAEVIAFATASYVDETMYRPALAEGFADVFLGLLNGDFGSNDQLDVEVLRVVYFVLMFRHELGAFC